MTLLGCAIWDNGLLSSIVPVGPNNKEQKMINDY
jgi:hypothetical protein